MGNLASSLKFFSMYDLIEERNDFYFGHLRILVCKANQKRYFMKKIHGNNKDLLVIEQLL